MMKFSELPVGAEFLCRLGKFRKLKNGADKYNGNAIGVNYPRIANIQGSMLCTMIK